MGTNEEQLVELKPKQTKALNAVKSMRLSGVALDSHLDTLVAYVAAVEMKLLEYAQKLDGKGV